MTRPRPRDLGQCIAPPMCHYQASHVLLAPALHPDRPNELPTGSNNVGEQEEGEVSVGHLFHAVLDPMTPALIFIHCISVREYREHRVFSRGVFRDSGNKERNGSSARQRSV